MTTIAARAVVLAVGLSLLGCTGPGADPGADHHLGVVRSALSTPCTSRGVAIDGVGNGFIVPAGWPTGITFTVAVAGTNCSLPSAAVCSFSNGDPPISMAWNPAPVEVVPLDDGDAETTYEATGTWTSGHAVRNTEVKCVASNGNGPGWGTPIAVTGESASHCVVSSPSLSSAQDGSGKYVITGNFTGTNCGGTAATLLCGGRMGPAVFPQGSGAQRTYQAVVNTDSSAEQDYQCLGMVGGLYSDFTPYRTGGPPTGPDLPGLGTVQSLAGGDVGPAENCRVTAISGLLPDFMVAAGWPTKITATYEGDCPGSIACEFSNGDPPLTLISVESIAPGRWKASATWSPANRVSKISVTCGDLTMDGSVPGSCVLTMSSVSQSAAGRRLTGSFTATGCNGSIWPPELICGGLTHEPGTMSVQQINGHMVYEATVDLSSHPELTSAQCIGTVDGSLTEPLGFDFTQPGSAGAMAMAATGDGGGDAAVGTDSGMVVPTTFATTTIMTPPAPPHCAGSLVITGGSQLYCPYGCLGGECQRPQTAASPPITGPYCSGSTLIAGAAAITCRYGCSNSTCLPPPMPTCTGSTAIATNGATEYCNNGCLNGACLPAPTCNGSYQVNGNAATTYCPYGCNSGQVWGVELGTCLPAPYCSGNYAYGSTGTVMYCQYGCSAGYCADPPPPPECSNANDCYNRYGTWGGPMYCSGGVCYSQY